MFRQKVVIGLHLLRVETNRKYRIHAKMAGSDVGSSDYIRSRHVFYRSRNSRELEDTNTKQTYKKNLFNFSKMVTNFYFG